MTEATQQPFVAAPQPPSQPSIDELVNESRKALADMRAALAKQDQDHARQIADLQNRLYLAQQQPAAPAAAQDAPAWQKPEYGLLLVNFLIKHGDQPRSAEVDLPGGFAMLMGVRNLYLTDGDGRIASIPVHWSDL